MRSPIQTLAQNIIWTRTGSAWAMWRLKPLPYGYRSSKDKSEARALHQALIRNLPGESLLLGVCATLDPAAVVERMIEGVSLESCPDWAAECEATLDTLDSIGIGERAFWLAKPLVSGNPREALSGWLRSAWEDFADWTSLPRPAVPTEEIQRRLEQAGRIQAAIPSVFQPTPATPAQVIWLHLHAQQRGLFTEMGLPTPAGGVTSDLLVPQSSAACVEALLDEGGQSDLTRQQLQAWNPVGRRFLKVTQPSVAGVAESSYQSLSVLADVPADGMLFPGSEFQGRIDESGLDVDWAMRLNIRSSDQVASQNRRAMINLNDQFDQRSDDLTGGMTTLSRAAQDLAEYTKILESDKLEVEAQATILFATAGPDADTAQASAKALSDYFGAGGYRVIQPLGYQEDMWWAMMPGAPANRVVREFAQITTSRALSATVPLASTALGDTTGSLLGINISSGRYEAVLHDIAGASLRDMSGSIGIAGALGSGKSVAMKTLAGGVVDRGGQIIAPDRTAVGEWEHWASAVTDATIVDVASPAVSLDPLRMYGHHVGSRIAQSFMTTLLRSAPTKPEGLTLSDVLDPDYLAQHDLEGLGAVLKHLQTPECSIEGAAALARKMNVFARKDLGRVIFDDNLPPLQATAPAVIVRTHTLELPNADELLTPQLFEEMSVEKIFGRAVYTLIAGIAREICFSSPSRLGVFVVDECHHLTNSPEGERAIKDFVRDGRKHQAAVILGSHDPEADFGSETLRGLIPTRIQMRQTDRTLARKGLRWLDMDPSDDSLVEMLVSDTSPVGPQGTPEHRRGEAFMRDANGSIGRIKVLAPSMPARRAAVMSSPAHSRGE